MNDAGMALAAAGLGPAVTILVPERASTMPMKFAAILPAGGHDEPVAALGGRTPLEVASVPNLDWVARRGA